MLKAIFFAAAASLTSGLTLKPVIQELEPDDTQAPEANRFDGIATVRGGRKVLPPYDTNDSSFDGGNDTATTPKPLASTTDKIDSALTRSQTALAHALFAAIFMFALVQLFESKTLNRFNLSFSILIFKYKSSSFFILAPFHHFKLFFRDIQDSFRCRRSPGL